MLSNFFRDAYNKMCRLWLSPWKTRNPVWEAYGKNPAEPIPTFQEFCDHPRFSINDIQRALNRLDITYEEREMESAVVGGACRSIFAHMVLPGAHAYVNRDLLALNDNKKEQFLNEQRGQLKAAVMGRLYKKLALHDDG